MKSIFREPQIEEGIRNIILQNRCGNRLTWMGNETDSELEFVYKPNGFRRKELAARNFSDRDNFTKLFRDVRLPQCPAAVFQEFGYDPFCTVLRLAHDTGARQRLTLVNIADENCFAITALQPLAMTIRPHAAFEVQDGLLTESFLDRGEEIVSFVSFSGYRENRYRVLDDGTHVLQLIEDDVLLIGGEETKTQVTRMLGLLKRLSREQIIDRNEEILKSNLTTGKQVLADSEMQKVVDINRRLVWSGLDAGGACFGALNRIYHLIWVRDGSMSTNHMALAGMPEATRLWAPFLLNNPSRLRHEDGEYAEEFAQIVGSRWTKTEDDGLFYAVWTAYTHFRTTGDDQLIQGKALPLLLRCTGDHLAKCWDENLQLMGSDTLGEDLLAGSLYYGYDTVNGKLAASHHKAERTIERCYSLYHQVNTYNVLRMLTVLLQQRPELDDGLSERYASLAEGIRSSLLERFVDDHGELCSLFVRYDDDEEVFVPWGPDADFWEHAWAVSQGPFFPLPSLQLAGARMAVDTWSEHRSYGYCPWNVLARTLSEHGMDSEEYRNLLEDQIQDALALTKKYAMPGAMTEYHKNAEGWRGLPFSAGSFINSTASQLLQSQAQGLAVRGGLNLNAISSFQYRLAKINVTAEGADDGVGHYVLNGQTISRCLQLPENSLQPGRNELVIRRGASPDTAVCRIHGSDAELISWQEDGKGGTGQFRSAVPIQIRVQGLDQGQITITDQAGDELTPLREDLPGTDLSVLNVPAGRIGVTIS